MKLKKFEQFINEARGNVADVEVEIEENIFLINEKIYSVSVISMGGSVEYESADPSVGIMHGGSYVENWWPESLGDVETFKDPAVSARVMEEVNSVEGKAAELGQMGLGTPNKQQQMRQKENLVWDALFDNELVEVTDPAELDMILESINKGTALDLTGRFDDRVNSAFQNEMEDYDSGDDDYDDYDRDWDD